MNRSHTSRRAALLASGACALVLAACGGTSTSTSSGGGGASAAPTTMNLGFVADMQVPDPDIFYEIEGNAVVTSVYEGLVRYKPNSTEIEPAVAESFTKSEDGLTYTFTLRTGVKFHDGTVLDAAAAQKSFERRTQVNSAPAYMLADVAKYETPDPQTFVVQLKQPVSAFLDYLAAPYGPKMVSPKVLAERAGSDFAQTWLKTHDAGTGPFTMTDFVPGDHYTLSAFADYWGGKPDLEAIKVAIVPDISTQRLELESGQLTMITHGLSRSDIESLSKNSKLQVQRFPSLLKNIIMVNDNRGIFKELEARTALRSAIDKAKIVEEVYGSDAVVSKQLYPAGELPATMAADDAAYDPSKLEAYATGLASKKVDLAYTSDDARNQRVANFVQTQLQAAGLQVTTRGIPIAQAFDLPNNPDQIPDLLVTTVNPDAAHPDTWIRIFHNTDGALNWTQCSNADADVAMDEGLHATSKDAVEAAYGKAGDLVLDAGCVVTIGDLKEVIVADAGYKNFVHQLPTLFTVRFGDLTVK